MTKEFFSTENLKVNEEKTKELLQDLKNSGEVVGIEDLSTYIRSKGLIVKEHVGRKRSYVEIAPQVFGVDMNSKNDEFKNFFKQHFKLGKIRFIPESYEKELQRIEGALRMKRRRATIGMDETFMPITAYHEFCKEFEAYKKRYFEVRDKIVADWDNLMRSFSDNLRESLIELNAIDSNLIHKRVMAHLPKKDEFKNSFYMTKSVKAFPIVENIEMFDPQIQTEIQESINEDSIQMMYEIIGLTLNEAFENVSKLLKQALDDKMVSRTIGAVRATSKRMGQKNIFANQKIEELRKQVYDLTLLKDSDEVIEEAEIILSSIYVYAKDLNIESQIDFRRSPLSISDLEAIAE